MKKIFLFFTLIVIGSSLYAQKPQLAYKASLDSMKLFIDLSKKENILNRLVIAHPNESFDQYRAILVDNFVVAKNSAKALYYFNQIQETARIMYVENVATGLMAYDLKAAETLVKQELNNSTNAKEERLYLLQLYSQVADKLGDHEKAFAAIKECYEQANKKTAGLTAQYFYLMSKTGRYQEALPELEKAVLLGLASDSLKIELKNAYSKVYPNEDSNAYLNKLTTQFESKYKAELAAKMISEQAPEFKVRDINGKEVSLSDFKGKTIVIDFWATWCGPCKKSLPAMQMMVNKYKNDPTVKFLFIHTWETSSTPKSDAVNYLLTHNFDLPLYMDLKDSNTKTNPAVTAFNVSGIPTKFIIDGHGKIRFREMGLLMPNDFAVKQLSAMIDLSR